MLSRVEQNLHTYYHMALSLSLFRLLFIVSLVFHLSKVYFSHLEIQAFEQLA